MSTSKVFAKISEKHPVWILNQNTVTYSSSHYQPKVFSQINICYTQWCSIFVSVLVFVFVFLSQQYICQLLEGRLRESAQLQINSLLTLSSNNSSSKPLNPLILHIFKIVRTSTFVCHKKTVFEAGFFFKKVFIWLTSAKWRPPRNRHSWKAMDLSFLMVFLKTIFSPAKRQNFCNALGIVWTP